MIAVVLGLLFVAAGLVGIFGLVWAILSPAEFEREGRS